MSIDYDDVAMEDRLWPWLADGSMSDETLDCPPYDDGHHDDDPWYSCEACGCGLEGDEETCPDCGLNFPETDRTGERVYTDQDGHEFDVGGEG